MDDLTVVEQRPGCEQLDAVGAPRRGEDERHELLGPRPHSILRGVPSARESVRDERLFVLAVGRPRERLGSAAAPLGRAALPDWLERLNRQLVAAAWRRLEPRQAWCLESAGSRPQRRLARTPSTRRHRLPTHPADPAYSAVRPRGPAPAPH